MAKKITGYIKLQVPAGKANPAPPIGPALGQHGLGQVTAHEAADPCNKDSHSRLGARANACASSDAPQTPGRRIGVLCRKNDTVARMIYELRRRRIEVNVVLMQPFNDMRFDLYHACLPVNARHFTQQRRWRQHIR